MDVWPCFKKIVLRLFWLFFFRAPLKGWKHYRHGVSGSFGHINKRHFQGKNALAALPCPHPRGRGNTNIRNARPTNIEKGKKQDKKIVAYVSYCCRFSSNFWMFVSIAILTTVGEYRLWGPELTLEPSPPSCEMHKSRKVVCTPGLHGDLLPWDTFLLFTATNLPALEGLDAQYPYALKIVMIFWRISREIHKLFETNNFRAFVSK